MKTRVLSDEIAFITVFKENITKKIGIFVVYNTETTEGIIIYCQRGLCREFKNLLHQCIFHRVRDGKTIFQGMIEHNVHFNPFTAFELTKSLHIYGFCKINPLNVPKKNA